MKPDPKTLKITDLRFADIDGMPKRCTLVKLYTNQGLIGYGEVRDGSSRTYCAMLKSRILGENPCNIERIFRRIRQFGGDSRQGGGVSAIEVACCDLAGKAWGVPVWQLLGGKYRDRVRLYCDTDGAGDGRDMGMALKNRMEQGYTFLKMDLGIELLMEVEGALSAPLGFVEEMKRRKSVFKTPHGTIDPAVMRGDAFELFNTEHPFTGIHLTEKGLDFLDEYFSGVRSVIGYEVPLAIDHVGHIPVEDCIRLARRLEKYNPAWLEDPVPWRMTESYRRLAAATTVPIATGEDIFGSESFRPLCASGGVAVIHPDVLSCGGIFETKRAGDLAAEYGVAMAIHMAESPIACLAAVHAAAATRSLLALEIHSVDVPDWADTVIPKLKIENGYIAVPDAPGLGIEALNEDLIREKSHSDFPEPWNATSEWDKEWSNDRLWS